METRPLPGRAGSRIAAAQGHQGPLFYSLATGASSVCAECGNQNRTVTDRRKLRGPAETRGSRTSVRSLESHSAGGTGKDSQAAMVMRSQ